MSITTAEREQIEQLIKELGAGAAGEGRMHSNYEVMSELSAMLDGRPMLIPMTPPEAIADARRHLSRMRKP